MPKTKDQKEELVAELSKEFKGIKAAVFTNYQGLTVAEIGELRSKLRDQNVRYSVVKTTLARLAVKDANLKDIEIPEIKKPLAIAFSRDDEVAAAKVISEFAKVHKKPEILSGILESKMIDADEVKNLARLLGRNELLAKFVYAIKSPISGFVNVLAGNMRGLVNVLAALKDQKEEAK